MRLYREYRRIGVVGHHLSVAVVEEPFEEASLVGDHRQDVDVVFPQEAADHFLNIGAIEYVELQMAAL